MRALSKYMVLLLCLLGVLSSALAETTPGKVDDGGVRRSIADYLDSGASLPLPIKAARDGLEKYYLQDKGPLLWTKPSKLDEFAKLLSASGEDGLFPKDYAIEHIQVLRDTVHSKDAQLRAWLELSYSSFLIRYAQDLGGGRVLPQKIAPEVFGKRARPDAANILHDFARSQSLQGFSVSQMPADEQYERLRKKLAEYQLIARGGGWGKVPGRKSMRLGNRGKRVERMRARLEFTGDVAYVAERRDVFDEVLEQAVKRYQKRNGMKEDGIAGRHVIIAMNISAEERVRQIAVNMERWRWIRDVQAERVLTVNLASNTFRYEVGNELVEETPLVRRKANAKLPVMSDDVSRLEVRPSDIVPPAIAGPAYFERISKDPGKAAKQGIQIYFKGRNVPAEAIEWSDYSAENFPFTIRRRLNKGDPAGYIRLTFSENDAACLGGAVPQKRVKPNDKFAPNCLTLVRADEFTNALLGKDATKVGSILADEKRAHAIYSSPFETPIPVRILYATAWVDNAGIINFRPDRVHRDLKLYKALQGRHSLR
ncbi:MAG: peptidoglycan-binding protein [Hyphomicrobiales bacterium]